MTQTLTDFFTEKKQRSDSENVGIDWPARKREWLHAIDALYVTLERLMADPIRKGVVTLAREPREITEDHLGTYAVEDLIATVGDERVTFAPRARNVVGASGRVDVRGERGEAMLVVQPGPRWMVVESKYPTLLTVALDADSLADLLAGVMRP